MKCTPIKLGAGVFAIVCTRGERRKARCSVPGCDRDHARLCDFPVHRRGVSTTCNAKLCDGHATNAGPERDYCPAHSSVHWRWLAIGALAPAAWCGGPGPTTPLPERVTCSACRDSAGVSLERLEAERRARILDT